MVVSEDESYSTAKVFSSEQRVEHGHSKVIIDCISLNRREQHTLPPPTTTSSVFLGDLEVGWGGDIQVIVLFHLGLL